MGDKPTPAEDLVKKLLEGSTITAKDISDATKSVIGRQIGELAQPLIDYLNNIDSFVMEGMKTHNVPRTEVDSALSQLIGGAIKPIMQKLTRYCTYAPPSYSTGKRENQQQEQA